MKINKGNQKPHSKLGIISFGIAVLNIGIFAYFYFRVMTFIMTHPELIKNPMLINGMKVAPSIYISFVAFFALQIIGLVLGLSGLFNSNVKKLFPILGTALNGIFAVLTGIKI